MTLYTLCLDATPTLVMSDDDEHDCDATLFMADKPWLADELAAFGLSGRMTVRPAFDDEREHWNASFEEARQAGETEGDSWLVYLVPVSEEPSQ